MIVEMSKGKQLTIPAELREEFQLSSGARVEIFKRENEIIIRPIGADLKEMFKKSDNIKPKKNLTAEKMDELIEKEVLDEIHR